MWIESLPMPLLIELRDWCAFDQHVCFFVLKKFPTGQECFQIGIIATTILRPLSRSSWPLRNIHFSNGKWSFPFFIYFVLSLVIDKILNYRTWQWTSYPSPIIEFTRVFFFLVGYDLLVLSVVLCFCWSWSVSWPPVLLVSLNPGRFAPESESIRPT